MINVILNSPFLIITYFKHNFHLKSFLVIRMKVFMIHYCFIFFILFKQIFLTYQRKRCFYLKVQNQLEKEVSECLVYLNVPFCKVIDKKFYDPNQIKFILHTLMD